MQFACGIHQWQLRIILLTNPPVYTFCNTTYKCYVMVRKRTNSTHFLDTAAKEYSQNIGFVNATHRNYKILRPLPQRTDCMFRRILTITTTSLLYKELLTFI